MFEGLLNAIEKMSGAVTQGQANAVDLIDAAAQYDGLAGCADIANALRAIASEARVHAAETGLRIAALQTAIRQYEGVGEIRH